MNGKQLQEMIKGFRIKQRDIAKIIGLSPPTLSLCLNGKVDLPENVKNQLETFLSVCAQVENKIRRRKHGI